MKQFTTPGVQETKKILVKMKIKKASKHRGRCVVEAIKVKLEDQLKSQKKIYNCDRG